jgi:acetolactate synthase regulatory subunit
MVLRGNTRTRFSVLAEYDPNTLSRVLELFTIRGIACDSVSARRTEEGFQWIELDCTDVGDQDAGVLLNKIRQIITVKTARIETLVLRLDKLAA